MFLFCSRVFSERERALKIQIKASWVFPRKTQNKEILSPFEKRGQKRAGFVSKCSDLLGTCCASESICTLQASKSLSLWPALGMENCLFESVVSSPRTVFIVVPENNICRQQSFSCPLSATIAVMKTGPAVRGLRGMSPPQSSSVRSGHLAGPPPGHLLEDGR